jgi:hypothetical protein
MASATEAHARRPRSRRRERPRDLPRHHQGRLQRRLTPIAKWWYPAFGVALLLLGMLVVAVDPPVPHRHRRLGQQQRPGLGLGHHQLRLLGRHRPRRHADQRGALPVPPGLAHQHQPLGRGDDDLRRGLRRHLPDPPHRPSVVRVVDDPAPERHGHVAAVPQPAHVGRVRDLDLRHHVDPVLVHGHGPRPGDAPRPVEGQGPPGRLRPPVARLARLGPAVAPLRARVPDPRGALDAAGAVGALGGVVRLRHLAEPRLAHDDPAAVLRRRRHLQRLRDGDDADDPAAPRASSSSTSSPRTTSTRCAR